MYIYIVYTVYTPVYNAINFIFTIIKNFNKHSSGLLRWKNRRVRLCLISARELIFMDQICLSHNEIVERPK